MTDSDRYLVVAWKKDSGGSPTRGTIVPYKFEDEVRDFWSYNRRGILDIVYDGSSKEDAQNSISGLPRITEEDLEEAFSQVVDRFRFFF